MSALMTDVLDERVSPLVANATVNAGGKLLKAVELQYRFGTLKSDGSRSLNMVETQARPKKIAGKAQQLLTKKAELEAELERVNADLGA